jgi:hypothetical protein
MFGLLCFAMAVLASPSKIRLEAENAALRLVAKGKVKMIGRYRRRKVLESGERKPGD